MIAHKATITDMEIVRSIGEVNEMENSKAVNIIHEIMNLMEERELKQWEAEWVAKKLPEEIKENSRRKESHQPFTVFKWD